MNDVTEHFADDKKRRFNVNKNFIMIGISLLLGGAGVFLSKQFIEDKIDFYRSEMQQTEEMTSVVVVARDMVRGEIVTPDALVLRDVPVAYTHNSAVVESNHEIALGQRLSFDIAKGKSLLWAHLAGGISPTFSGKVPEGLRALTVPVDEINSISGFLQPKDSIDLMLTHKNGKEDAIVPLMQNLHVMATGIRTEVNKSGSGVKTYRTITVQVTPEDAKRIILARDTGKVTATLRNPGDAEPIGTKSLTVSQLLGKKPRRRQQKKRGIEYIVGGA